MAKSSARGRSLTPPQVVSMLAIFLALSGVGGVLSAGFATPFVGVTAALTKASAELFEELPSDFDVQQPSQISTLYAADGQEITQFYAENRIVVPLSEISVNMQNAIVAVEDQRFYQHQGVDPTGMVRALVSNNAGGSRQGASTLTQQYVRNTLIETGLKNDDHKIIRDATESTVARKLREMKYALSLEQKYSKQQILEGYLNIAAFSPSTYGVEASARHYFSKSAKDLTVAEAALMAGTTNAPTAYDPVSSPDLSKKRMDWVLTKMLEEGFITQEQHDEASATPIESMLNVSETPAGCGAAGSAAYFCTYVVNEILGSENFGANVAARRQVLQRGGLKITTTLDLNRQSAADGVIQANTPIGNSDGANSTIASIEPGTGKIRAIAQNTNYEDSQLVFAADAKHGGVELPDGNVGFQPGSTFKALILTEWLKNGHTAGQTVNASGPRTYPPNTFNVPCDPDRAAGPWTVNNVAGTTAGVMTVRDATKQSMNVGFTEMLRQLDVCEVTRFAASVGITKADGTPLDPEPSLALGANPVPPLSMANVYATFASGGKYCKPIAIESVLDASGTSMAVPSADCTQALEAKVADQTATTLQATSEPGGTAKDAAIGRPIAGKTGTTDEAENAWFVGFTPQLSTAVWIGDAKESSRSLVGRTIGNRYFDKMYGSDLAVPMWRDYMSQALANDPYLPIPSHS